MKERKVKSVSVSGGDSTKVSENTYRVYGEWLEVEFVIECTNSGDNNARQEWSIQTE